jgi:hypothetical protein
VLGRKYWRRKYENELNEVRNFALKFPGVGNLSRLPTSGTPHLQQMKRALIIKLWKEKYPAESGVDYDDDISVWANIPKGWWLNHVASSTKTTRTFNEANRAASWPLAH